MTIREFSDYIVAELEKLELEVVLQNPTSESIFPCLVVQTPLERIDKTYDKQPIYSTYQIVVEAWADKQREVMDIGDLATSKLLENNLAKSSTSNIMYDEITKKYRILLTFEVKYNHLTNGFSAIR